MIRFFKIFRLSYLSNSIIRLHSSDPFTETSASGRSSGGLVGIKVGIRHIFVTNNFDVRRGDVILSKKMKFSEKIEKNFYLIILLQRSQETHIGQHFFGWAPVIFNFLSGTTGIRNFIGLDALEDTDGFANKFNNSWRVTQRFDNTNIL